jgi:hypothetical protein
LSGLVVGFVPFADITAAPERCMVFATPNREGRLIATGILLPRMIIDWPW